MTIKTFIWIYINILVLAGFFIIIALLPGCEIEDWRNAPSEYTCSEKQMVRVEKETIFCNNNTKFYSTFCYGNAIIRNCTKL